MLKKGNWASVWAFDIEWVPDLKAGRLVYGLDPNSSDDAVLKFMWKEAGATEEDPKPFIKTVLCRIVSIAAVIREVDKSGKVKLELHSLPEVVATKAEVMEEGEIITRFLEGIGKRKPQLIGYNSSNADLPILLQRGVACGLHIPSFGDRPAKPWEGSDYFVRTGEWHLDLKDPFSGWGKGSPSLNELAVVSGIPGKIGTSGEDVQGLWQEGKISEIVQYNHYDALTTYLLWLRAAHFSGFFTTDDYLKEQHLLENLIEDKISKGESHLQHYLNEWMSRRF